MKQESEIRPTKAFEIENINEKNNRCEVVFFDLDNITEETRTDQETGNEKTVFLYYSYRLNTAYYEGLLAEITANYSSWFNNARNKDYEAHAKAIRDKRNMLLAESDIEMCIDRLNFNIPTNITATSLLIAVRDVFTTLREMKNGNWANYRQALRDLTNQSGFPYNVEFPTKPE